MAESRGMFQGGGPFQRELRRRVDAELTPARRRAGTARMIGKSALIGGWALASYLGLLLWAQTAWQVVALSVSLGLALAGVGFAIQHDANHGAYVRGRRMNRAIGVSLDLIGASSYIWRAKHNHAHHSFTNVVGADTDIDQLPLARFAPDQPRHWFHRWQHLYMWPLYGFYAVKHHLAGDLPQVIQGRVGDEPHGPSQGRRPGDLRRRQGGLLELGAAHPLLLHPVWFAVPAFLIASWVLGFTLAVVFHWPTAWRRPTSRAWSACATGRPSTGPRTRWRAPSTSPRATACSAGTWAA